MNGQHECGPVASLFSLHTLLTLPFPSRFEREAKGSNRRVIVSDVPNHVFPSFFFFPLFFPFCFYFNSPFHFISLFYSPPTFFCTCSSLPPSPLAFLLVMNIIFNKQDEVSLIHIVFNISYNFFLLFFFGGGECRAQSVHLAI